ncbi:outer membrane beta-barrel protein [Kistimonas asteriae]|uniref:outer membrane beta-barrel protein n=1 Tax=Kistimonas asteriae TaxID=517724 RepID=UPI001BA7D4C3|nr:outer membrane beta-barrel protein [Kistimonas asteriae]
MKKVIIAAAVVSATSMGSIGSAMASDWFIGVEAGKARNEVTVEKNTYGKASDKVKHTDLGLRVGKYLNENVRTYATITSGKNSWGHGADKIEMKDQNLLLSADYLFGDGNLKPFVGATVGTNRTKIDTAVGNETERSFAYGAQAGVVYALGQVDLEAGYRYLKHNSTFKFSQGAPGMKLKNKDTQKVYLSAAYRF